MIDVMPGADPGGIPLILPVRPGDVPGACQDAARADGFTGDTGTACDILGGARRVLLVGLGTEPDFLAAGALAARHLLGVQRAAADLRSFKPRQAAAFLAGAALRAWRFDRLRTRPDEDAPRLAALHAIVDDTAHFEKAWSRQRAAVEGTLFARDLVTEPSNTLTPDGFIARLDGLAEAGVTMEVLRGDALREAGLTGLLAVGGGSAHPPALAILRYPGTQATPPVTFVGKGITFDTGGICIKPADRMWEMRADMAGAAACAGAVLALARRGSPCPAIAVLALAENATGAASYRPSDVLRLANGTTIEIIDTDAEGRLVLADALGWAVARKPAAVIDLATLTGSVVVALGHHQAGLFANDDSLAASAAAAGAAVGERLWRLPIDASHRAALDSGIADLRHCSPERLQPDACQAAAFLRHFVGGTPWLHLDIAGVENREEGCDLHPAGASGFGVRLLDRLVQDRFEDPHRA